MSLTSAFSLNVIASEAWQSRRRNNRSCQKTDALPRDRRLVSFPTTVIETPRRRSPRVDAAITGR